MLRDMRSQDLSEVLAIERNAHITPWSRLSFEESLNRNHICRVLCLSSATNSANVQGFHVVCPIVDELHILNITVARAHQGEGLGHVLMQDIFDIATQQQSNRVLLEVRAGNQIAQSLYAKWGFAQIGLRKAYYRAVDTTAQREDALVFCRVLV